MKYRREVDGLRALAVVPVILFHAGFETFSGGFVGVDVFFVISGYLITSLVVAELEAGKFSLVEFYERRARRILPALFLVVTACVPFAWLWLLPSEMKAFSQSVAAAAVFGSNILFWRQSGYFDTAAELKPLLHTWSLGIEEQFYVLFPLFLLLTWRLGKKWILSILTCLALISVSLAHWGAYHRPAATFFLLPTRGWELALGSLLAFNLARPRLPALPRVARESGGFIGLILLVVSVFAFDSNTPFPSLYALLPTVGTALLILFAWPDTLVGRILGARPLVGIGLISYSSYLWHQPLFAFARHRGLAAEFDALAFIVLSLSSVLLAYLSWKFVEAPFRSRDRFAGREIFSLSIAGSLAIVFLGTAGHLLNGIPSRFPEKALRIANPETGRLARCDAINTITPCFLGSNNVNPSIAILGDSHSAMLSSQLADNLSKIGVSALLYQASWCVPLIDVGTSNKFKNPSCRKFMTQAFGEVLRNPSITKVVLVSQWSNYTKGYRWNDSRLALYTDSNTTKESVTENSAVIQRGLRRTLDALKAANKNIVIVKSVPEYETEVSKFLAREWLRTGSLDMGKRQMDEVGYAARNVEIEGLFEILAVDVDANIVKTFSALCPDGKCRVSEGDEVFYTDDNHLSKAGSAVLIPYILSALQISGP